MPTDLIWDIAVEEEPSPYGKCIRAPESMFEAVAGILFKIATEKPDKRLASELNRDLIEDFDFQARLFAFATQLFSNEFCEEGEDEDMKLRQRPDNPCILQQLQAGEWIDVFDYSLCMQIVLDAVTELKEDNLISGAQEYANELMNFYTEHYTGTSASFDPKLTMDHPDGANRRLALCEALFQTASNFNAASLKAKEDESASLSRAALAIGAGIAVVGFLLTLATAGAFGPALAAYVAAYTSLGSAAIAGGVAGLTATGLSVWSEAVKATAQAVFEDTMALREYVCIWYETYEGMDDISFEAFSQSIDVSEAVNENVGYLEVAFAPLRSQPLAYAAFLRMWKRSVEFSENGIEMDCTICDDPDITLYPGSGGGGNWSEETLDYMGKTGEGYDVWIVGSVFNGYQWSHMSVASGAYIIRAASVYSGTIDGVDTNGFTLSTGFFPLDELVGKTTGYLAFYTNGTGEEALLRIEIEPAP